MIVSHPVVSDPTDAKGLPWPDAERNDARFLPLGEVAEVLKADRPTCWFWDDLGQAAPSVQAAYMQWLLARRVGSHVLPDCVTIAAATNRRQDRAGVQGILEPVKSRFATIIGIEANLDDWVAWALTAGIDPVVIAFLRSHNALPGKDAHGNPIDLLSPEQTSAELVNSPSPRTWANVAKLYSLGLPKSIEAEAYAGAVGQGASVAFMAFLQMYRSMVSIDQVLLDPHMAPMPNTLSEKFAVCTGLASRCEVTNFDRIAIYLERLNAAGMGEFATLGIRDSVRRCPGIAATPAWIKTITGPLGRLMTGKNDD